MWRPEGWDEIAEDCQEKYWRFEDGYARSDEVLVDYVADAMLEALVKQGYYITPATYIDYPPLIAAIGGQNKKGHIVFIEEIE